jgi:hypothetical protein
MEIDLPEGGAKVGSAARSRFGTALIPCRTIERERDWWNMVDVLLSLSGKYI